jgi:hypothetical protein
MRADRLPPSCLGTLVVLCPRRAKDKAVTGTDSSEQQAEILQFRPRGTLFVRKTVRQPLVPDLSKFEQPQDEADDFRHRMMMNGLGFAVTVLLIVGGIWIAEVMAHMQKDQDCVLSGRKNCAPIPIQIER